MGDASWARIAATVRDSLESCGSLEWTVVGQSMMPTLPAGCTLRVRPWAAGESPKRGDIVVFVQRERLVVHRLVRLAGSRWLTQGDGVSHPDPLVVPEEQLGRVQAAYQGSLRCWPTRTEPLQKWRWIARYYLLRLYHRGRRFTGISPL